VLTYGLHDQKKEAAVKKARHGGEPRKQRTSTKHET
jgi:hypothetical protein